MGIGEQFKGLDMKNLIGGPLSAAAESSVLLARSTADFINTVGFDANKKARTVMFKFNKQEPQEDGSISNQEMAVDIPLLAIVPIPNLQIDEVNILFDMEVKQTEKSESSTSGSGSFSAKMGWGPFSVSVSGSVSAHSSNTRSSDNSAKYHVDVRATNHGIPEGLARVLDMMAANVAPNMLGSRPVDETGAELAGARRERTMKLKALREETMRLESAEKAARDTLDIRLDALTKRLQATLQDNRLTLMGERDKATDDTAKSKVDSRMTVVENYWNGLISGVKSKVEMAASATDDAKRAFTVVSPKSGDEVLTDVGIANTEFNAAVAACKDLSDRSKATGDKKVEYNAVMMS